MNTLCNEKLFAVHHSSPAPTRSAPLHLAVIMDGNGRWAARCGQSRSAGHAAGAASIYRIAAAATSLRIDTLTLYACPAEHSLDSPNEFSTPVDILGEFLRADILRYVRQRVRVSVIGRRDRLPSEFLSVMQLVEQATAGCDGLHLRIAVDYSSRETIFRAACRFYKATRIARESFEEVLGEVSHATPRDVDLVIRTGNERRLSDFLLWEAAHAELHFSKLMWPDFTAEDLAAALEDFYSRQRSFRDAPQAVAS